MPKNIIDKIWESHVVKQTVGHPAIFGIDLQLLHEVTSSRGFDELRKWNLPVKFPRKNIATLDHSIPTRLNRSEIYDEVARKQVEALRKNCTDFNIKMYDFDSGEQGIVHIIGPELGLTQPGMSIVCGDSHTSTHGAFGALAFGIGISEVNNVLATGCILQQRPKTMKVEFRGQLPRGVYSKDLILKLISEIGVGGANGHIIEYTGEAIKSLSMEARMTICNMSIECGARAGLVGPDENTLAYIQNKKYAPKSADWDRAVGYWQTFVSDEGAKYDKEIVIDISTLEPMISWGTNPSETMQISQKVPYIGNFSEEYQNSIQTSLDYTKLKEGQQLLGKQINWVFLGSCTNSRIEDLRIAAEILKNKKIAENLKMYVVPGSEAVKAQAEKEGLDEIFTRAGGQWRMPGCSMCIAMNDDKVPSGQRCVSTSNRNFMNRQGPGAITHLASPATAAASAIEGRITDCRKYLPL